uniref:PIH1 N-terminal domain-containing protein n=1 Tax=Chromera velia CCMP2878 TaxID=1169474 RepID=A0A0G4GSX0_9ALVE|eukprot:Cvel_23238.t1-p1 / transcript=Cvel_23238.t1 / gene=Cvel_23238 / organism=Chromera_velia_CCMP2878 / gene_product=hypothetical protein / transcript_product=hypothetical protein / location=Cvel_scaffold2373:14611-16480(-) / protein_length=498 / sequence_SO=supercontig / SO=protein_coding / is_pseudo=false
MALDDDGWDPRVLRLRAKHMFDKELEGKWSIANNTLLVVPLQSCCAKATFTDRKGVPRYVYINLCFASELEEPTIPESKKDSPPVQLPLAFSKPRTLPKESCCVVVDCVTGAESLALVRKQWSVVCDALLDQIGMRPYLTFKSAEVLTDTESKGGPPLMFMAPHEKLQHSFVLRQLKALSEVRNEHLTSLLNCPPKRESRPSTEKSKEPTSAQPSKGLTSTASGCCHPSPMTGKGVKEVSDTHVPAPRLKKYAGTETGGTVTTECETVTARSASRGRERGPDTDLCSQAPPLDCQSRSATDDEGASGHQAVRIIEPKFWVSRLSSEIVTVDIELPKVSTCTHANLFSSEEELVFSLSDHEEEQEEEDDDEEEEEEEEEEGEESHSPHHLASRSSSPSSTPRSQSSDEEREEREQERGRKGRQRREGGASKGRGGKGKGRGGGGREKRFFSLRASLPVKVVPQVSPPAKFDRWFKVLTVKLQAQEVSLARPPPLSFSNC